MVLFFDFLLKLKFVLDSIFCIEKFAIFRVSMQLYPIGPKNFPILKILMPIFSKYNIGMTNWYEGYPLYFSLNATIEVKREVGKKEK